jgi:hypothetical protein
MSYQLILTIENQVSLPIECDNINYIINDIIKPVINVEYTDDDYPSILIKTKGISYSYNYLEKEIWKSKVQYEEYITGQEIVHDKLSWNMIVEQWKHLLMQRHKLYKFSLVNINNTNLDILETMFNRSIHVNRLAEKIVLLIVV